MRLDPDIMNARIPIHWIGYSPLETRWHYHWGDIHYRTGLITWQTWRQLAMDHTKQKKQDCKAVWNRYRHEAWSDLRRALRLVEELKLNTALHIKERNSLVIPHSDLLRLLKNFDSREERARAEAEFVAHSMVDQ